MRTRLNFSSRKSRSQAVVLFLFILVGMTGCTRLYYATMEKVGKEKRDILVGRVEDIREKQTEAKEQFQTTLEAFQELTGFEGGELEELYDNLEKEYDRSEDRAKDVRKKIDSIEKVARDLFKEWRKEIVEIQDPELNRKSRQLLEDTVRRYEDFASKLNQTEAKMNPVLQAFKDQVLFLKHNLNAQAIDSLKGTVLEVGGEVAELVKEMEISIQEADQFIQAMAS